LTSEQVFAQATRFSSDFQSRRPSLHGLVGLASSKVAKTKHNTLLDTLFDQGAISRKAVSFYLVDNPDVSEGSKLFLGEPDMSFAPQGFTTIQTISESMWVVHLDAIGAGDESFCTLEATCAALLDTGLSAADIHSSLIVLTTTESASSSTTNLPCSSSTTTTHCHQHQHLHFI